MPMQTVQEQLQISGILGGCSAEQAAKTARMMEDPRMRKMMQQIAANIKAQAPDGGLAATAGLLDAVNPVRGDGLRPLAAEQASYKTGDAVRLVGLTSEKGAQLNGKEG